MLKNIAKLRIKGKIFETPTELPIFIKKDRSTGNETPIKGTVIYGRNGSGKSTIAAGFSKLKGESVENIDSVDVIDKDGNIINLTTEEKAHIFVFDTEFIDTKVKLVNKKDEKGGMQTIVMLGELGDIESDINKKSEELEQVKSEIKKQQSECEKYEKGGENNLDKLYDDIKALLKTDDGWVIRAKKFGDSGRVTDAVIHDCRNSAPSKGRNELVTAFNDKLEELKKAEKGLTSIIATIPLLHWEFDDTYLTELLAKKIEKLQFSDRENYLMSLVADEIRKIKNTMESSEERCPFCFQEISSEYKYDYLGSINRVLSKDREEHEDELERQQKVLNKILSDINNINIKDIDNIKSLDSYTIFEDLKETSVGLLEKALSNIKMKIDTIYNPIEVEELKISSVLLELSDILVKLNNEKDEYNSNTVSVNDIKEELKTINNQIGYYEIEDLYNKYEKSKEEKKEAMEKLSHMKRTEAKIEFEMTKLKERKEQVDIAADEINKYLAFILGTKDRLTLEYDNIDRVYKLKTRGQGIKTKQASVGEQNIIALSYFFASILEHKSKTDAYSEEHLIVIDDPVSSFDASNRVGIMSFLRYIGDVMIEKNRESKILITTHDLKTAYDIDVILQEINATNKKKWKCYKYELKNKEFIEFADKRNEYEELMRIVYRYANEDPSVSSYDIVIGNIMRQVLEAYSTFTYGSGMVDISRKKSILSVIPDEEDYMRRYFKDRMYKLYLNGGSHKEESVRTLDNTLFFNDNPIEKRDIARDIICLLYKLNSEHVLQYLTYDQVKREDVELIIKGWIENIPDIG